MKKQKSTTSTNKRPVTASVNTTAVEDLANGKEITNAKVEIEHLHQQITALRVKVDVNQDLQRQVSELKEQLKQSEEIHS